MRDNYTVYVHVVPNNKVYIGLTCTNVKSRWRKGVGYINNRRFYNAIKKYEWDNIEHIVIADGLTQEEAYKLEKDLIKCWDTTNPKNGYNISVGGASGTGVGAKPVVQYDLNFNKVGEYEAARHAEGITGIPAAGIRCCCNGYGNTAGGYVWIFKKDEALFDDVVQTNIKNHFTKSRKRKAVIQYDLEGNKVNAFPSIALASEKTGVNKTTISAVCRGSVKTAGGFLWKYVTNKNTIESIIKNNKEDHDTKKLKRQRAVIQYDLNGNKVKEYSSITAAAQEAEVSRAQIVRVCSSQADKTGGGYIWKYANDKTPVEALVKEVKLACTLAKHAKSKKVIQYELNGAKLNEYTSVGEASKKTGAKYSSIASACRGESKTAHGFIWRYTKDERPLTKTNEVYTNGKLIGFKAIVQYDLKGKKIKEYPNNLSVSEETGISLECVRNACSGRIRPIHGFILRYATDPIPEEVVASGVLCTKRVGGHNLPKIVTQYDLNMNKINEFKSVTEASKETHTSASGISNVCLGYMKTSHGYIWRYKDNVY